MLDKFAKGRYEIASSLLDNINGEEIRILLLQITIEASKKNLKHIDDLDDSNKYDAATLKRLAESLLFRIVFDKGLSKNEKESAALVCAYAYETLCPPLLEETNLNLDSYEFLNRIISSLLYYIAGYDPNAEVITSQLDEILSSITDDESLEVIVIKQLYNFARLKMSQVYIQVKAPYVSNITSFELLEEHCRNACLYNLNDCLNKLSNEFCYVHTVWSEDISSKLNGLSKNSRDCGQETITLLSMLLLLFEELSQARAISILISPSHCDPYIWKRHMKRYIEDGIYLIWPPHKEAIIQGLLDENTNNIIAIPTGTGKSLIAEHKVISYLQRGSVIIYLAPTLALCRQITKNMKKIMDIHDNGKGSSVLIDEEALFSESNLNENEDMILVMTPEKCVSLIANNSELVSKCTLCIIDEFHNIFHGARGALLDLLLSRISQISGASFLIMSALIDDSPKLEHWLKKLNGNHLAITKTKWRPARTLRGFVSHPETEIERAKIEAENSGKNTYRSLLITKLYFCVQDVWAENNQNAYPLELPVKLDVRFKKIKDKRKYNSYYWTVDGYGNDVSRQLGNYLASSNMSVMIFSQGTRHLLNELNKHKKIGIFPQTLTEVTKSYLTLAKEELGFVSELNTGLKDGIGIHTQALINEEQLAVEDFYQKITNGVLCATGTISQGLNLAASVVIVNTTKQYSEQESKSMSKSEVLNMLGRAGRPGFGQQSLGLIVPQYPSTTSENGFTLDSDSTAFLERIDGVEETNSGLLNIIHDIAEKELNEEGIDDDFTLITNVLGFQSQRLRRDLLNKTLATQFLDNTTFDRAFDKWNSWLDSVDKEKKEIILKAAVKSANKASVIEVIIETINQKSVKKLLENEHGESVWLTWFFECISKLDIDFIQKNIHELFTSNEVMIKFLRGWIAGSSILELAIILNQYDIGKLNKLDLSRNNQTSIAKSIKIIREGIRNVSHIATAYISIVDIIVAQEETSSKLPDNLLSISSCLRFGVSSEIAVSLRKLEIPRKISNELSQFIPVNMSVTSFINAWKIKGEINGIAINNDVKRALFIILK
ncbi:DEAD/DEAH box helicase [Paenisporosarcina antarctica]|uniref:DEAD/DEAH box helicase n=1 Tax=Paenisporosarcina antarctica TaxID=417367 RepID=A0A4P7A104_9BACL|nr:DEAD/DEAH box helicase [Paenisporosarcina antarctica]QBP42690.1 DEAD/DEAH box helicase [Paenisporosarcina antarctica]